MPDGVPSSISVPNTGPSAVETDKITLPDGSSVYRQVVEMGEDIDLPNIRAMLEEMYLKYMYGDALPLPAGRSASFDENGDLEVTTQVSVSGGAQVYKVIALGTTNAMLIKPSMGQVYGWHIMNVAAATRFIKLYNVPKTPNVGVDIPTMTLPFPAGAAANVWFTSGIGEFVRGIGIATTVNAADADATAVTVGDLIINIFYH